MDASCTPLTPNCKLQTPNRPDNSELQIPNFKKLQWELLWSLVWGLELSPEEHLDPVFPPFGRPQDCDARRLARSNRCLGLDLPVRQIDQRARLVADVRNHGHAVCVHIAKGAGVPQVSHVVDA